MKHPADGLAAAPPFGRGAKGHTRIQQADSSRVGGLTCKVLDPGFVGAALQHIDVPALLKTGTASVPGKPRRRPAQQPSQDPQRKEHSRVRPGNCHRAAAARGFQAQRRRSKRRSKGRGSEPDHWQRQLHLQSLAEGAGQLGRKACSRLAHAGLAAKNLRGGRYAPFTADLQVCLRHPALSYKVSAGEAATAGAAEFKEPGLL